MAAKHKYSFSEQRDAKGGKAALHLAVISLICFLADILISLVYRGEAGAFVGAIAIAAALLSVYGFSLGMRSFSEKDVRTTYSVIGSISCGAMMIAWLTLLLNGLS